MAKDKEREKEVEVVTIEKDLLDKLKIHKKELDQKEQALAAAQTELDRMAVIRDKISRLSIEVQALRGNYDELLEKVPDDLKEMFGGKAIREALDDVPGGVNQRLAVYLQDEAAKAIAGGAAHYTIDKKVKQTLSQQFGCTLNDVSATIKFALEAIRAEGVTKGQTTKYRPK